MRKLGPLAWTVLLLAIGLLVACSQPSPTFAPQIAPGDLAVTPTFTPLPALPTAPPTVAAPPATAEPGPLPALLADIPLAPADETLQDLLLDRAAGRLYVTDTAGQLHVLDADTYTELATLPAAGNLTLDAARGRLYVWQETTWDDEGSVTIVDVVSLSVVDTLSPGGLVAVDDTRNRFYVGNRIYFTTEKSLPGVRVYNGATLEKLGVVPQPGIPVYNPLRDELAIVAYTVYLADPETLQVTADLLPDITAQQIAWCNGCRAAVGAYVFTERNLLLVDVVTLSTGGGPGRIIGPRFFDAATLDEITDTAQMPSVQRGCDDRFILAEPVQGRTYRGERVVRYVVYNNLLVYGSDGALETWRDGLPLGVNNPRTNQMYLPYSEGLRVLDLETLSPQATLPAACIHTLDAETGRIYAWRGGDLIVLAERGAFPDPPPTDPLGPLPAETLNFIQLSPAYPTDRTLYLGAGDANFTRKLYRSTDGGQTWTRLRGGLPEGDYLALDLAISPDYTADRTLFVGGFRGDSWGEGVYRSQDGGDTWQPMWRDLAHLRVNDVALSPDYAADGTLLAYASYYRIQPWSSGRSVFRSTDRGLSWSLVVTSTTYADGLPSPETLLPSGPSLPDVRFRTPDFGRSVERSSDGGQTWQPVVVTRQPDFTARVIIPSPQIDSDRTVYVLSDYDLFRSTDGGDTWHRWDDDRLAGRDYSTRLMASAVSPLLDDGSQQIFIGSAAGEFWTLDPTALDWAAVIVAPQWPTFLPGEWVGEIGMAPNGDVWLASWGGGLARYAEGGIQARYTVTDGLSSQYIGSVAVAPDGVVWAGGDLPPGVASFDGQTWTPAPLPEQEGIGSVYDLTVGPDGTIWAGAATPGILRWNGQGWDRIADPEGRTGYRTYEIEVGPDGALWCATSSGLAFYSDGLWSGGQSGESLAVEFGPDGAAYLLTASGVIWRYDAGGWARLPTAKPYLLNPRALYAAADGALWLGTAEGVWRYDGQTWQQFTAQDGLPDNEVAAIAEDAEGWLWFGTRRGAGRVNPATLGLKPVAWPTAAPTPTPPITSRPTPCAIPPAEPFAAAYAEAEIAARLACPVDAVTATQAAFQPFEQGRMFWRADLRDIDMLHSSGWWARYDDTWDEAQPASDPSLTPPQGLEQPVRGFGKVWREQLGGSQAAVGWALAPEQGYEMLSQPFGGGQMFTGLAGEVFVLYTDRTWLLAQ